MSGAADGDGGAITSASSSWVDDHRHPSGYQSSHSMSSYHSGYHSSQSATGTWGAGEYDAERSSRGRGGHARSRSPSTSGDDRSREHSRERAGGGGSRKRDSSRERGRSSKSGDGGASAGRKRSRDETTGAASFSPLVHDSGVKDTRRRRRDHFRRQLIDRTPFDVLSDPDYVSAVCGKAVEGDAARRILPHLLDAMGMEIVQQQTSTPKIPSQIGGSKETGDKAIDTETLDAMNVRVRPKKKNPDNTPGTVREFALTQVTVRSSLVNSSTEKEHDTNVLDEIFAAFRVAAHHTVVYADEALGDLASSSIPADRKQKIADIARRALMTCFVTFRGLLLRLAELADDERNEGKSAGAGSIGIIFGEGFEGRANADGAPSAVEGIILDIVPLLTHFFHPPLGEKRALSLLQNLLSLDETARKKKRSSKVDKKRQMSQVENSKDDLLAEQIYTVITRDSLMEVFVRQLLEQEGEAKRKLGRELLNVTSSGAVSKIDVGAVAALRSKITCPKVQDIIEAHRNDQDEAITRRRRIVEAQNDGPSWDHEYQSFATKRKRLSPRNLTDDIKEDLHLLRLDGCIYLSRIAARILTKRNAKSSSGTKGATEGKDESQEGSEAAGSLTPTPQQSLQTPAMTPSSTKSGPADDKIEAKQEQESSVPSEVELASARPELSLKNATYERDRLTSDDVQAQRERICSLAYFLFHTLMDHYARAESEGCSKTTSIRREDIPSASLACYLLAGKMEECPVKVRTLLNIIKSVGLPPPPSTRIDKCCKRLKDIVELNDSSTAVKKLSLEWGKPTPEVMKQYEVKLLSILGFDFLYGEGCIHPSTNIDELAKVLSLDSDSIDRVKSVMNGSSYTHSSLCLLGQPKLVTAAMYYLSCDKTDWNLHEQWGELLDEDEELVKLVANYAWEVRNCTRAREKQWQAFVEFKTNFDAIRQSVKSHSSRQESQSSEAAVPIPPLDELNVDTSDYDCFKPPQPLSKIVGVINVYLAELGHRDGSSWHEPAIPKDIVEDTNGAMSEASDCLPIQELLLPGNAAIDITLSAEQTQRNESEMTKVEDVDDDPTNAKDQISCADEGNIVEAEGSCDADTCATGSVKIKERSTQKGENSADKNIVAGGDEETTAVKMVSSGAGAIEEADSTKSIPSEHVDDSLSSTKSASPEPSKSQGAKSPIAFTPNPPVHSLQTPAIMSERSKSSNSSAMPTTSDKAKAAINKVLNVTLTSKRGRDTRGNDQEPNEELQSKRRMVKIPISRPNSTILAPQKESVPSHPPPSGKSQPQSSSSNIQESTSTLSHSQLSEQQASPRQSKRKQRSSPSGKNGWSAESSPKAASQQTKRKRQMPGAQPTSNERPKLQSSPDTKKRKGNVSMLAQGQSSPTNRRPRMRFGQAAFAGMMNHLGMSGGGASTMQVPKRGDGGGGGASLSSPPTFDDSESPQCSKQRTSPEKAAARSKAKPSKNKKKDGMGVDAGSVTYHFTIDDNDSPSPRGRGRAAQKSAKPKPNKNTKEEEGVDVGSVTYHFTIDDKVSPSPRGRGRAAPNSTKPKPNNKKSKGQRKKKRYK